MCGWTYSIERTIHIQISSFLVEFGWHSIAQRSVKTNSGEAEQDLSSVQQYKTRDVGDTVAVVSWWIAIDAAIGGRGAMACNTPTHLLDGGKELENDGSNCYCSELVAMLCVCIQTRTRGLRTAVHSL